MSPPVAGSRDALRLLAGCAALLGATLVHAPALLAAALVVVWLLGGPGRSAWAWRAVRLVLPVMLMLSAGWLLAGWWQDALDGHTLLRLNLRLLLLSLLVAWIARAVDFDQALRRWPAARRWLAIVRVQIAVLRRAGADYQAALRSRSVQPPTWRMRTQAAAAHGLGLLDKAVHNAEAVTLAMRSRGALDD